MRVAFLGLGRMGVRMAAHVLSADHDLVVWNRSSGKAGDLTARGATEAATVGEGVQGADAVVLMLFGPDSVREVLGRLTGAAPGALVVNSTTVGPEDAKAFAATVAEQGLRYVDAPVAGSLKPAEEGTLGILVGAAQQDHDDALPLLTTWGDPEKVRHVGEVGSGSALKLCVNQGLGVVAAGVGETLRLGQDLGLSPDLLLEVLGGGVYGWYLGQKASMISSGDFSATTFSVELMAKDLQLAVDAAGAELPVTAAAAQVARTAAGSAGGSDYSVMSTLP